MRSMMQVLSYRDRASRLCLLPVGGRNLCDHLSSEHDRPSGPTPPAKHKAEPGLRTSRQEYRGLADGSYHLQNGPLHRWRNGSCVQLGRSPPEFRSHGMVHDTRRTIFGCRRQTIMHPCPFQAVCGVFSICHGPRLLIGHCQPPPDPVRFAHAHRPPAQREIPLTGQFSAFTPDLTRNKP